MKNIKYDVELSLRHHLVCCQACFRLWQALAGQEVRTYWWPFPTGWLEEVAAAFDALRVA
jgi:hypothetical protein